MLIQAPSQANKQPLEVKKFRVSVGMRQQQQKTQFHKHQKMCLLITYPFSVNNTNLAINIADPNEFITYASQKNGCMVSSFFDCGTRPTK